MNSFFQLVSQVLPWSVENACSHFATTSEPLGFTVHVNRTMMGLPLKKRGLVLGYGGVNARQIQDGVHKLAAIVKAGLRP